MDTSVNNIYTNQPISGGFPRGKLDGTAVAHLGDTTPNLYYNYNFMLLEKTLHMSQPLAECKARLASIQSYRRQFLMVTKATVTSSKTLDFSFRGPLGFLARTVLLAVESDSPSECVFESVGGNIELMGLVDFAEIRPSFTEITLAVDYEIKNKLFAWIDRRLHFVDGFVNAELRSIRAHFEGIAAPYVEPAPILPMFETAAAA